MLQLDHSTSFLGRALARTLARLAACLLCMSALGLSQPVHADQAAWAGARAPQGQAEQMQIQVTTGHASVQLGAYFSPEHRQVVHQEHARMIRSGHCPPGLARKGNGCMPPGQAKKPYAIGKRLPPDVVYHELSPALAVRLGAPPAGHRFVRVAADVLLIAIGTGMVMDAIEDLGR